MALYKAPTTSHLVTCMGNELFPLRCIKSTLSYHA